MENNNKPLLTESLKMGEPEFAKNEEEEQPTHCLPKLMRKEVAMSKNKTCIPSNIVDMMRVRGYAGSGNVGYYEAMKWMSEKYGLWLVANPRYLTPIDFIYDDYSDHCENKILMWEIEARDLTSWMSGDYYCRYYAIHQYDNPTEQALEDADVYGLEVCEDSGKFYKSYEDAICAGLIRTMLWLEKGEQQ